MTILIADDHPIFRKGLAEIIVSRFPQAIITEVDNGKTAFNKIKTTVPDIAILDIEMPLKDGLQVCRKVKELGLKTKVIILTMYKNPEIFNMALNLGVDGFLLKDHSAKEITACVQLVMKHDERYISKKMQFYADPPPKIVENQKRLESGLFQLTKTEKKVLKLVGKNLSSKEIALRLFITPKSVENYRSRICKKLNLESRNNSLATWVLENKELIQFLLF